jgi:hypothetical protein
LLAIAVSKLLTLAGSFGSSSFIMLAFAASAARPFAAC